MPQRSLDGQVGVRLELATLATLAKHYYDKHELGALKSASTLVRYALNDLAGAIIQFENAEQVSASDAMEVLEDLGVFPRMSRRAHMYNVQEETIASEPHSRLQQWSSTKRAARNTAINEPARDARGKLQFNVNDEALIKREINRALASPSVQAALASESQETTSEPDEGEFNVEVVHEQQQAKK